MAALLRQGARRIAGSVLQRTQAALTSPAVVAEERRLLVPRRLYYTEEQATKEITRKVQQNKEELYHLICKAEQDVRTSTWPNTWLLLYLSEQVTPRPYDPDWLDMQKTRNVFSWVRRVSLFALTCVAMDYYSDDYSNDKKVAPAMMMEEGHDTKEVETGSRLMEMEN